MRQLKFHEKKLLKKVDFLQWKNENNQRELQVRTAVPRKVSLWAESSDCARDQKMVLMSSYVRYGLQVIRRYHIQDREDYKKYNKICGLVTKLVNVIKRLDAADPMRIEFTDQLLDK